MIHAEVSTVVRAPRPAVFEVYADYRSWPRLFPTIGGVRLIRRDGPKLVLEIDHAEGTVINELLIRPPGQIDLWEVKRRYNARFLNRFQAVAGGTRFTVTGDIRLRGWACLLRPFLPGHVRRLMRRLQLEPVKAEAERRVGVIPGSTGRS